MVYVDKDKCAGCGVCMDHCPVGAIRLVGGVATIDSMRCTQCGACVEACPNRAVMMVMDAVAKEETSVASTRPVSEMAQAKPRSTPVRPRSKIMPAVGAALAFLDRKVIPRIMDYVAGALDRRSGGQQTDSPKRTFGSMGPVSGREGMGGQRRRRRKRGS